MASKILLFVSPAQVLVGQWRRGALTSCTIAQSDEAGLSVFAGLLQTAGRTPVYVVADTVEEDYRFETLPHATGSDRKSLLDRKLRQYYRSTRFVSTLWRGHVGQPRRDDHYLFSALTNPALIEPWLSVIARHSVPVAGVYLAPMLMGGVLELLSIRLPRVLVAAPHASGLRLTFYKDGEFCSSRLTRPIPRERDDAVRMLITELTNTRLYLSTLHLDSIDEPLNVVFFDRDDRLAGTAAALTAEDHGLHCATVDRATLLSVLPVRPQQLDLALETLYLDILARTPPPANLAPAAVTAGFDLHQRRKMVYAASATVALAGLVGSGYNLWRAYDLAELAGHAARHTAIAQDQYKALTRAFPAAPTSSENLIKAVHLYQQVVKSVRSPQPFMQLVSRAINTQPEIVLKGINWRHGTDRQESGNAPATPVGNAPAAQTANAEGLRQSGTISGEVRPFHGDFRAAIAAIQRLARELARDPAVAEVQVVKLPLNVNPESTLTGDTRDAADHSGGAEFEIFVTLKPNV